MAPVVGTLLNDLKITVGRHAIYARVLDVRTASQDVFWLSKAYEWPSTNYGTTLESCIGLSRYPERDQPLTPSEPSLTPGPENTVERSSLQSSPYGERRVKTGIICPVKLNKSDPGQLRCGQMTTDHTLRDIAVTESVRMLGICIQSGDPSRGPSPT